MSEKLTLKPHTQRQNKNKDKKERNSTPIEQFMLCCVIFAF